MEPITWTAIATIASALIGGIVSAVGTHKQNEVSQQISSENIKFQQEENAMTRLREDNAQVRAAQDLEAAGLSKTLAAGSPASASALTAPQVTRTYEDPMTKAIEKMNLKQTIMDLKSLQADVQQKQAQTDYINAQTAGQLLNNQTFMDRFNLEQTEKIFNIEMAKAQIRSYDANTKLTEIIGENKQREIDADIDYKLSQIDLAHANYDKIREEIKTEIWKRYKLSKEAQLVVQDLVNAKLDEQIKKHDLNYSQKVGLPVGKTPSSWISDAATIYQMFFGSRNSNTNFSFNPYTGNYQNGLTGVTGTVNPLSGWLPQPI